MKVPTAKLILLSALLLITCHTYAQKQIQHPHSSQLKFLGSSGELRLLTTRAEKGIQTNHENLKSITSEVFNLTSVVIPIEPILNFDGIDVNEAFGESVPNANGDVSGEHYIQISNGNGSIFKIFDKTGVPLHGPSSLNSLWDVFGETGSGDPMVLWDQGAGRWLFSEVGTSGTNTMLVAISETSDPLGNWFAYSYETTAAPTYPKYSIWPNAYVVTTKENGGDDIPVYILDRQSMLSGAVPGDIQRMSIPEFEAANFSAFQTASPADWDGALSPPPPGSPHLILRMYDDSWDGGQDKLEIWEVNIDWNNPGNSNINGPIDLITEPFDSDVCNGSIFTCIPQPNGSVVSAMMQNIMHRVNYRNFGTHETLVLNHVVDVDGSNHAGIRWYELRKPTGGQWEIYQQATLAPDDNHRFMGSIAIDAGGNIGMAYSTVGPDKNLSLAYTGRFESDPINEMTITEHEFASGLSLHNGFRWGDHSSMTVDEENGFTFWFTGEYMKANSEWGTKIVSFQLHRDTVDIGVEKLLNPASSAYLTSTETLEVQIKNYGLAPQSDFVLGLIIDDVFISEKAVYDTIEPDSILVVAFDEEEVDFSEVQTYQVKIYTQLMEDANVLNDTFRTEIVKFPRFDAAVFSFIDLEQIVCDSFITAGIVIQNHGAEILDSVLVEWQCNTNPVTLEHWYGSLDSGAKDTIYVMLGDLYDGVNNLSATTIDPNGVIDEHLENDTFARTFQVLASGETVYFYLLTDDFAYETTWQLTNESGAVIYEGGPYELAASAHYEEWCLLEGCYTFTIFDDFGDGMSAPDNPGNYQITNEEGKIYAELSNTDFGDSEVKDFCAPFVCALESNISTIIESEFGAYDGVINVNVTNGLEPLQYSIDNGQNFQDSPVFSGLTGNIYYIVVEDKNGCRIEEELVLQTCTLQFSIVATNATSGLTDGSILINIDGGIPPFQYSVDNGSTFQDSSLFENLDTATYIVLVQDSLGCIFVNSVGINSMPTSNNNIEKENNIQILPNPTDGLFTINISGINLVNTLQVELLNVLGQSIYEQVLQRDGAILSGQFSLLDYPSGIYFVRIKYEGNDRMMKVIRR